MMGACVKSRPARREGLSRSDAIDRSVAMTVRNLRKARGVTQQKLADHLGVAFQQIQKYESGANRMSASTLYRMAMFFRVSVEDLFGLANAPRNETDIIWIATAYGGEALGVTEDELIAMLSLYQRVEDPEHRRAIRDLMMRLARVVGGGVDRRPQASDVVASRGA